jgi:OOP family OmpA-OmpF porin
MRKLLLSLTALLLTGLSGPTFAQANEGWYVGVSAGTTDQKDACDEIDDPPFVVFTGSCDDTDTGWKIFGGKQFTRNWGAEFGYADLGKSEASGTVTILGLGTFAATADVEATGFYAAGTGTVPFGESEKFGFFGKLGAVYWDVDLDVNIPGESGSETGISPLLGFGLKYDFTERIGIRGEWERFFAVGDDEETGESDVDLVTIGVVFWF